MDPTGQPNGKLIPPFSFVDLTSQVSLLVIFRGVSVLGLASFFVSSKVYSHMIPLGPSSKRLSEPR